MVGTTAHDHKVPLLPVLLPVLNQPAVERKTLVLSPIRCEQMRVYNITNGAELFNGDMGGDVARCMSWSPTNSHLIAYSTDDGKVNP
jgi:hypothetical protein